MLSGVLAMLLSSVALLLATVTVTRRLPLRGLLEKLVAGTILYASAIILISLVVGGLFRAYAPFPLLAASIAVSILVMTFLWRSPSTADSRLRWRWPGVAVVLLTLLTLAQYVWRSLIAVRLPALDWDGLQYHLVAPDTWIQAGRIMHSPQSLWSDVYPLNVELLLAWPGVFLHTTRYAPLAQLPLMALGAVAVAGIARRLDATRLLSLIAALAYLAMPAVFAQASTTYIDVSATAFALAALYLITGLVPACRSGQPVTQSVLIYGALTGAATGLAVGSKAPNLVLLPVLALAMFVSLGRLRRISSAEDPTQLAISALAVPIAVLGSFWYLRTWITYGNPLHPFSIGPFVGRGTVEDLIIKGNTPAELHGQPLGPVIRSWSEDFYPHLTQYDTRIGGLGMAWVVVIVPLAIAATVHYVRNRRGPLPVFFLAAALTIAASPAAWWARYVLLSAAIGCAFAAAALTRMSQTFARVCVTTLTILTGISMWWATNPSFICPADTCRAEGLLSFSKAFDLMWQPNRAQRIWPWPGYQALSKVPDGSVIAVPDNPGQAFTHPLIGDRLQRKVVLIANPASAAELAAVMERHHAQFVLLDPDRATQALALAASRDSRFALRTSPDERIDGHDLFQFGEGIGCDKPDGKLVLSNRTSAGPKTSLTFVLVNGCKRVRPGEVVELYSSDHDRRMWHGDVRSDAASTDETGRVTFTVDTPRQEWRYFARYPGTDYNRPEVSANVILAPVVKPGKSARSVEAPQRSRTIKSTRR